MKNRLLLNRLILVAIPFVLMLPVSQALAQGNGKGNGNGNGDGGGGDGGGDVPSFQLVDLMGVTG